jgi:hypothetical protein
MLPTCVKFPRSVTKTVVSRTFRSNAWKLCPPYWCHSNNHRATRLQHERFRMFLVLIPGSLCSRNTRHLAKT